MDFKKCFKKPEQKKDWHDTNQMEELVQRAAWRLVRSAADRMGDGRGTEKLMWCVDRLRSEFPEAAERAEDHVRSAYVQFKTEKEAVK